MFVFLYIVFSVFLFYPSHEKLSKGEYKFATDNYVTNYRIDRLENGLKEQKNNASWTVGLSSSGSVITNNSSDTTRFPSREYVQTKGSGTRSQDTLGSDGGGSQDRRNFNDFVPFVPADWMSFTTSSQKIEREADEPNVSTGYFDESVKEAVQEENRLPSRYSDVVTEVSSKDFSVDPDMLLKLDRKYTPKEIAEYILSTGDEKGIIQVIADMLQDGLVMVRSKPLSQASRDDVIVFLETVQNELDKLKRLNHVSRLLHSGNLKETSPTQFSTAISLRNAYKNPSLTARKHRQKNYHQNVPRSLKKKAKPHNY